jgi:glycosyltransferase involved in cell wall biosynthesis
MPSPSCAAAHPVVSLCIPTFNRQRYLASLLECLTVQLAQFPFPFEVVISDNASPDATADVVRSFSDRLPIRYLCQSENIGGFANYQCVIAQARGRYVVNLSDDDCILGDPLADAIARMEADPELAVLYAPWLLYDLVAQQDLGQFYTVPQDLRVERNRHRELLDHILRHHIFPEIQIVRRDALERVQPRIDEHAFYAFVHAADYLTVGAVLIQQAPFYVAMTRYFADDQRSQTGNEEASYAWDRYRGGLEYLLASSTEAITPEERLGLGARIQRMIAHRMSVAIRLRHTAGKDPRETFQIAMRLRGMGYESLSPVPLDVLASEAATHFLYHDAVLHRGVRQIVCIGEFAPEVRSHMRERCGKPIEFVAHAPALDALTDTLLFVRDEFAEMVAVDDLSTRFRM